LAAHDIDDYWTVQVSNVPETIDVPSLRIEAIEGVEPLTSQFSVINPNTVPDALHEPLWGQPEDCKAAPMHTYVILDAAKVPNLPELLEESGLAHRCLFNGKAYNDLKDVAPWVVRLEEGNTFTRNIFISSDAPWHLWDQKPGIFVRSRSSLEHIWQHFRKFTKVQDENGVYEYFRFWEIAVLDYIAFFGGEALGEILFLNSVVIWPTNYYHSGMKFASCQVGASQ